MYAIMLPASIVTSDRTPAVDNTYVVQIINEVSHMQSVYGKTGTNNGKVSEGVAHWAVAIL
jgi:hypothetical protein